MAQHDFAIDNAPGLTVRTDINAALAAIQSSSSGPVEPVVKAPGQAWFDTSTPAIMRLAVRDQANATWVNVAFDAIGAGYVSRAGDTMTGALNVNMPNNASINLNSPAGKGKLVQGQSGGSNRWAIFLGDGTAESGSNAGANFSIGAYTDAGAFALTALSIIRSNGAATFGGTTLTVQATPTSVNPMFYLKDKSGTNRGALQFFDSTGNVQCTNLVPNSWWVLPSDGSFAISSSVANKPGGGSWTASSDERLKTDIVDYSSGLEQILDLRPVNYKYRPECNVGDGTFTGLIAQECETIMPEMVTVAAGAMGKAAFDDMRSMDTTPLIFALINAVKTLNSRIEALEAAGAR